MTVPLQLEWKLYTQKKSWCMHGASTCPCSTALLTAKDAICSRMRMQWMLAAQALQTVTL